MSRFKKNDLLYKNRYNWDNEITGSLYCPSLKINSIFNRHDGYQVLNLINYVMGQNNLSSTNSVIKIETMLITLSDEQQSHEEVRKWIISNWNRKIKFHKKAIVT